MRGLLGKLEDELKIRNSSGKTIRSYVNSIKHFLNYSTNKGLNQDVVREYILKNLEKKNPSSVSKDLFAIKFFFSNVLKQPLELPNPKKNKTLPNILTIEEIRNIICSTGNIKHKLIMKLLYGCGLRVSEMVDLKNQDLNFDEGLIKINLAKGKKDRFVKIPSSINEELENYSKTNDSEYLFHQIAEEN